MQKLKALLISLLVFGAGGCQTPEAANVPERTTPLEPSPRDEVALGITVALPLPVLDNPRAQQLYLQNTVLTQYALSLFWQNYERRRGQISAEATASFRGVNIATTSAQAKLGGRTIETYYLSFIGPRPIDPPHRVVEVVLSADEIDKLGAGKTFLPQDYIVRAIGNTPGNRFRARLVEVGHDPTRGLVGKVLLIP